MLAPKLPIFSPVLHQFQACLWASVGQGQLRWWQGPAAQGRVGGDQQCHLETSFLWEMRGRGEFFESLPHSVEGSKDQDCTISFKETSFKDSYSVLLCSPRLAALLFPASFIPLFS